MAEVFADGGLVLEPGRIATVTLNAPGTKNALTRAMWAAWPAIAARIAADDAIRAVIVTGAGGAFSAGADISEFDTVYATPASAADYNATVRAGQQALRDLPRPVIASIHGPCVGGGCGIALSCDLRFAAPDAIFAITPARLGIAYSPADAQSLIDKVGPARAKDILFSARKLDAAEALALHLIERICDDPLAVARDYAEGLAALSPASLRATKTIINGLSPAAQDEALQAAFEAVFVGPDFAEGRRAFMERRKPQF